MNSVLTEITDTGDRPPWALFVLLVAAASITRAVLPPWLFMWLMAGALFLGWKLLAWPGAASARLSFAAYLFLWPAMSPPRQGAAAPAPREWLHASANILLGAALFWGAPRLFAEPLAAGWAAMIGFIFLLHFGLFHLTALAWRTRGFQPEPLMRNPLAATSLAEFWGARWNRAFSEVARRQILLPLAPRLGLAGASMAVFLFSGLVHELVITLPAGTGYGIPTAYFAAQGSAALWQRSTPALRQGWRGRLFTLAIVAVPLWWLFPPAWITRVWLPFLHFAHAL